MPVPATQKDETKIVETAATEGNEIGETLATEAPVATEGNENKEEGGEPGEKAEENDTERQNSAAITIQRAWKNRDKGGEEKEKPTDGELISCPPLCDSYAFS